MLTAFYKYMLSISTRIQGFDGETWGKETTWKTQA